MRVRQRCTRLGRPIRNRSNPDKGASEQLCKTNLSVVRLALRFHFHASNVSKKKESPIVVIIARIAVHTSVTRPTLSHLTSFSADAKQKEKKNEKQIFSSFPTLQN